MNHALLDHELLDCVSWTSTTQQFYIQINFIALVENDDGDALQKWWR